MVVAAETERARPGLAAVAAGQDADAEDVDDVVVVGVDDDLAVVVAGIAADGAFLRVDLGPGRPGVGGPVDLAVDHARARSPFEDLSIAVGGRYPGLVGVLDLGVEDPGVLGIDGQADAPDDAVRQPVRELAPGLAAVGRLVDAGARPADAPGPGPAEAVVGGRVEGFRVGGVHDQVDGADGPAVDDDVEDLDPGLPGIGGLEYASLGILGIEMAQGRDVDGPGIGRMDDDAPDMVGFPEAHVRPGLPGVGRPVDAVSPVGRAGVVGFTRPQPEDVGVRRGHGDIADREDLLALEERLEGLAVVLGLPQAAGGRGRVERVGLLEGHREVDEPAALLGRSDRPEIQRLEDGGGVEGAGRRRLAFARSAALGRRGRGQGEGQSQDQDDGKRDLFLHRTVLLVERSQASARR